MSSLTVVEAIKYGFLRRCIEEGFDAEEADRRAAQGLAKQAEGFDPLGWAGGAAKGLIGAAGLGVVGAGGLGALGGYSLAKLKEPNIDPEAIRQQELIAAYNMHAQQAKMRALARQLKPPDRPSFARIQEGAIVGMTQKYFGRQDPDLHGGFLTWPGTADGFPIAGEYHGNLRQTEYEELSLGANFDCDTFLTWDRESMDRFRKVMDHVHNGQFFVKKRLEMYDEAGKGWRLYVEWTQVYGLPPRDQDAIAHIVGSAGESRFEEVRRNGHGSAE